MNTTPNYNLEKPTYEEFGDVDIINKNSDKIDAALKVLSDALGGIDLSTLSQAIANVDNKVTTHLEEKASKTKYGHVKIGTGINVTADGTISAAEVKDASTTQKGIVQLNNTTTSTSTTQAVTANVAKNLNDTKANKIQPNWITATLQNGWTGTVQYYKDDFGRVHVKGKVDGTNSSSSIYATLGVGNRPTEQLQYANAATIGAENLTVVVLAETSGVLHWDSTGRKASRINVDISFRVSV